MTTSILRRHLRVWLALAASLLLLAGCATLDERQREWIFQPGARTWWGGTAAAEGMQDRWIEFMSAETGDTVRLHALWAPQGRADAPVLLYLHGARYDVRGSAHRMRRLQALGFAVLGVDYRGFGQSSAVLPSEAMAYEDAQAAWDWLAREFPGRSRYVFGHSLGGAIAVDLASRRRDVHGLIVEGSFTSIPDVVRHFKWGWLPVGPLITQRFEAVERIAHVQAPVLVVHGSDDRLIPPALGQALYERAPQPKRFVLVEGGSHHSTNSVGQAQYRQALADLFGLRGAE
ncbi:MAG: alpha/beta fold hydrolase [Burkholderiaceae bacterium]|nr:alpha/beta fold hydrolase [Burkholderiaceae bacterium]